MKTDREQLTEIRDMVGRVGRGCQTQEEDTQVYRMFGSLSKDIASGVAQGITFALSNIRDASPDTSRGIARGLVFALTGMPVANHSDDEQAPVSVAQTEEAIAALKREVSELQAQFDAAVKQRDQALVALRESTELRMAEEALGRRTC